MNEEDFDRLMAGEKDLVGADLSDADLRGEDVSGVNFSATNLSGADLRGANLQDCIIDNETNFDGARLDFARIDFTPAASVLENMPSVYIIHKGVFIPIGKDEKDVSAQTGAAHGFGTGAFGQGPFGGSTTTEPVFVPEDETATQRQTEIAPASDNSTERSITGSDLPVSDNNGTPLDETQTRAVREALREGFVLNDEKGLVLLGDDDSDRLKLGGEPSAGTAPTSLGPEKPAPDAIGTNDSSGAATQRSNIRMRIARDRESLLLIARNLGEQARSEIKEIEAERPNSVDGIASKERRLGLLAIFRDGSDEIADGLKEIAIDETPSSEGIEKSTKAIERLKDEVDKWLELNSGEFVDWGFRVGAFGLGVAFLSLAGANMSVATPVIAALVGGKKAMDALKGKKTTPKSTDPDDNPPESDSNG